MLTAFIPCDDSHTPLWLTLSGVHLQMKDEPEIAIVKMDATANDVPSPYDVRGFPTLYFAPKDNKSSPKKYEVRRNSSPQLLRRQSLLTQR